jgi:hypothetical protein
MHFLLGMTGRLLPACSLSCQSHHSSCIHFQTLKLLACL